MRVLLVTYTLRNVVKDYSTFFKAIQTGSINWWHYLEDTWIVSTTESADDFAKKLLPHIETTDSILVVRIHPEFQGWLAKEAWDWLNRLRY